MNTSDILQHQLQLYQKVFKMWNGIDKFMLLLLARLTKHIGRESAAWELYLLDQTIIIFLSLKKMHLQLSTLFQHVPTYMAILWTW